MIVIALSMVCNYAWAATARFHMWERWLWAIATVVGLVAAWYTPLLWDSPNLQEWRDIVLSGIHSPF